MRLQLVAPTESTNRQEPLPPFPWCVCHSRNFSTCSTWISQINNATKLIIFIFVLLIFYTTEVKFRKFFQCTNKQQAYLFFFTFTIYPGQWVSVTECKFILHQTLIVIPRKVNIAQSREGSLEFSKSVSPILFKVLIMQTDQWLLTVYKRHKARGNSLRFKKAW